MSTQEILGRSRIVIGAAVAHADVLRIDIVLEPEPEQVGPARHMVAEHVPSCVRDDLLVALSELVTNAVEHARTPVRVAVAVDSQRARVEVSDSSTELPTVRDAVFPGVRGHGLRLVERLVDDLGVEANADGKTVWFELEMNGRRCG